MDSSRIPFLPIAISNLSTHTNLTNLVKIEMSKKKGHGAVEWEVAKSKRLGFQSKME